MFRQTLFSILLLSTLSSCTEENRQKSAPTLKEVEGRHAAGFAMEDSEGYRILRIRDPWQGADGVRFHYILAEEDAVIPDSLKGLPLIRVPVQRVICMSTTHIAMIRGLDRIESIVGISGRQYVNDPELEGRIEAGLVGEVGADQALN